LGAKLECGDVAVFVGEEVAERRDARFLPREQLDGFSGLVPAAQAILVAEADGLLQMLHRAVELDLLDLLGERSVLEAEAGLDAAADVGEGLGGARGQLIE